VSASETGLLFLHPAALNVLDGARHLLDAVQPWQALAGALVAILAAVLAFRNTSRSLEQTEEQETRRRKRKHAAIRAVLPLSLAQVSHYAAQSARALDELLRNHPNGPLPPNSMAQTLVQSLPAETLKTLADFIEYSDAPLNVGVVEDTVASIQIHDSRLRELVGRNNDPAGPGVVPRYNLMGGMIDAAAIFAGASAVFDYARRQQEQLPPIVSWQAVRNALHVIQIWNDQYETLLTAR
jgi:hypothetical protein